MPGGVRRADRGRGAPGCGRRLGAGGEQGGGGRSARSRSTAESLSGGRLRTLAEAALWLRIPERLERAGLAERVPIGAVLAGKVGGAALGAMLGRVAAPAAPGRLAIVVAPRAPRGRIRGAGGAARARGAPARRPARAALPDALDLLAVGTAAGRSPQRVLGEISTPRRRRAARRGARDRRRRDRVRRAAARGDRRASRPRARARGSGRWRPRSSARAASARRSPTSFTSRRSSLRRDARRRIEERAARAAPKIQLVVALVLVPSVLLMIVAALVANSDALFGAL